MSHSEMNNIRKLLRDVEDFVQAGLEIQEDYKRKTKVLENLSLEYERIAKRRSRIIQKLTQRFQNHDQLTELVHKNFEIYEAIVAFKPDDRDELVMRLVKQQKHLEDALNEQRSKNSARSDEIHAQNRALEDDLQSQLSEQRKIKKQLEKKLAEIEAHSEEQLSKLQAQHAENLCRLATEHRRQLAMLDREPTHNECQRELDDLEKSWSSTLHGLEVQVELKEREVAALRSEHKKIRSAKTLNTSTSQQQNSKRKKTTDRCSTTSAAVRKKSEKKTAAEPRPVECADSPKPQQQSEEPEPSQSNRKKHIFHEEKDNEQLETEAMKPATLEESSESDFEKYLDELKKLVSSRKLKKK